VGLYVRLLINSQKINPAKTNSKQQKHLDYFLPDQRLESAQEKTCQVAESATGARGDRQGEG